MKILVACEYTGVVRRAIQKHNPDHIVKSCDLLPAEDNAVWHYQGDVRDQLYMHPWDMVIAFPPCTHLSSSGARWFGEKIADGRQARAIHFFNTFVHLDCPRVAIENPVGIMSSHYRKPDQVIQPWQFGHGETKATCLWLKGLPILFPTNISFGRVQRMANLPPTPDRGKIRSRTYQGIAEAMAKQWT